MVSRMVRTKWRTRFPNSKGFPHLEIRLVSLCSFPGTTYRNEVIDCLIHGKPRWGERSSSVMKWKSEARPVSCSWKQNVIPRKKVLPNGKGSHFRSIKVWRQRTRTIVTITELSRHHVPINTLIPYHLLRSFSPIKYGRLLSSTSLLLWDMRFSNQKSPSQTLRWEGSLSICPLLHEMRGCSPDPGDCIGLHSQHDDQL